MNTTSAPLERTAAAIFFSGATYFIHFLGLGFASFPLQTHLRQVLTPSSASIVAGLIPIAACLTYFFFRFADARGWTRSPQRVLFVVAIGVAIMQCMLGLRLKAVAADHAIFAPAVDIAICLLMLGCVQSSCMTLLNHIGVATMGSYAYTVRAAGSAGYMVAVVLMGLFDSGTGGIGEGHLLLGAAISIVHAGLALANVIYSERFQPKSRQVESQGHWERKSSLHSNRHDASAESTSRTNLEWWGLLVLVWMVAMCEMSYSLYSHEFLTRTYGSNGYFVFAGAVAIEIALLIAMPMFPRFKQQLLFVGPVGWLTLFTGCLMASIGWSPMGMAALALALNCPFQISANEHAHRMNSGIMGVASMTLAQSLGYVTATIVSATVSKFATGPAVLWSVMAPVSVIALGLSIWKLRSHAQVGADASVRILEVEWADEHCGDNLAESGQGSVDGLNAPMVHAEKRVPARRQLAS